MTSKNYFKKELNVKNFQTIEQILKKSKRPQISNLGYRLVAQFLRDSPIKNTLKILIIYLVQMQYAHF